MMPIKNYLIFKYKIKNFQKFMNKILFNKKNQNKTSN